MKTTGRLSFLMMLSTVVALAEAQELPQMPEPEKEHGWLQQLAGEWETEGEIYMEADKPPIQSSGTENSRMLGGFWLVADSKGQFLEMPVEARFTLGYDPEKKKYVGTWVDSMMSYLWKYEGTVDSTGKILTLDTEGPCPKRPGKLSKFKEVIELKDPDQRSFTSSMQEDDGTWTKLVTVNYRRKK